MALITITVLSDEGEKTVQVTEQRPLLEQLEKVGINVPAPCGGRGKCGQCTITLLKGDLEITAPDRNCLRQAELDQGLRLACKAVASGDITIRVPKNESAEAAGFDKSRRHEHHRHHEHHGHHERERGEHH